MTVPVVDLRVTRRAGWFRRVPKALVKRTENLIAVIAAVLGIYVVRVFVFQIATGTFASALFGNVVTAIVIGVGWSVLERAVGLNTRLAETANGTVPGLIASRLAPFVLAGTTATLITPPAPTPAWTALLSILNEALLAVYYYALPIVASHYLGPSLLFVASAYACYRLSRVARRQPVAWAGVIAIALVILSVASLFRYHMMVAAVVYGVLVTLAHGYRTGWFNGVTGFGRVIILLHSLLAVASGIYYWSVQP